MIPSEILSFDGGYLKSLNRGDAHEGYVNGLNDPIVNFYLDGVKEDIQTQKSVENFIVENAKEKNCALWGIWLNHASIHVGTVRLHGIEYRHKTAHIGICLFDKTSWGKGVGSSSIRLVTQWAIDILGLRWIEAGIYSENIASQKAFITAGYRWSFDIYGKYVLNGMPADVKVYVASKPQ